MVLRDRLEKNDLAIEVSSGGTGDWHIGENANSRSIEVLEENNYKINHSAKQVTRKWFEKHDLFLAMDLNNYQDLIQIDGSKNHEKIKMFRHFDPELRILSDLDPALAVPDPYYGTLLDFQNVLAMIEKAADGFVDRVIESRKGNF